MKTTCRFMVLCAIVLFPGWSLRAQAPSLIEPKVQRHEGPPLWISAEAVADKEKIVNLDLIDSHALRERVEKQRLALGDRVIEKSMTGGKPLITAIPETECKSSSFLVDERGGDGPSATLADLATYSESIVRGTIRTIDLGFAFGSPASLLGVEVLEAIKGSAPKSPFYIDYPIARFKIGPFYFCNTNKGFEPRPGDEILLFDYTGPWDRDDVLYAPRLDQIFFQSQSGSLFLPPALRNTPDLKTVNNLDEVVDRLRSGIPLQSRGGTR